MRWLDTARAVMRVTERSTAAGTRIMRRPAATARVMERHAVAVHATVVRATVAVATIRAASSRTCRRQGPTT